MATNSFGLKKPAEGSKDARSYALSNRNWLDIFDIMYACVKNGAAPMLYTSSDGNALCLSIKHGKSNAKYWIGPDDDPSAVLSKVVTEWGIQFNDSVIDEVISAEWQKAVASVKAENNG